MTTKNKTQQEIYLIEGNLSTATDNVINALKVLFVDIKRKTKSHIEANHKRLNANGTIIIKLIEEDNNTLIKVTINEKRGSFGIKITPRQKMLNNFTRYLKHSIIENRTEQVIDEQLDKITISKITNLTQQIKEATKLRYAYFEEISDQKNQGPQDSASKKQIKKVEEVLQLKLPPSYKEFLLLHNGWIEFDVSMYLFSCEELIEYYNSEEEKEYKTIAIEESGDNFIKDCIIIGKSEVNSSWYLLDINRKYDNGEYAIIEYEYEELETFKNFTEFLIPSDNN